MNAYELHGRLIEGPLQRPTWANHPERHRDEFVHEHDFREHRDRIGDLLLVPKPINASYGDAPYAEKLPHYFAQNILARSLHPDAYEHNPGFARFRAASGLPFRAHPRSAPPTSMSAACSTARSPSSSGTRRSCCASPASNLPDQPRCRSDDAQCERRARPRGEQG